MSHKVYFPKQNERGSARVKLVIFLAVFGIIIYVGIMYIPVAVDAYYFKDAMQNKVDAAATQGFDTAWVKDQLEKSKKEFNVPPDATIAAAQKDNQMTVRVQFTRQIPFPGYSYKYEFDHTAFSKTYLFK